MKRPPPTDLAAVLERDLPAPLLAALQQAAAVANALELPCYLVGGPVRDLLLERPVDDLDLVVEGDAPAVAERFAQLTGGELTCHDAFRTANVALTLEGERFHIDFVTARSEHYPQPAALPVVSPSTLHDDLRRRDFTINTLAVSLSAAIWGELVDVCGGLVDLERRSIRVLHDRSFVDDPTRMLRAARFATRLGFALEEHTRALLTEAAGAGMIERTSPARILHEFWLVLRESAPEAVFHLLQEQEVLPHIVQGLDWTVELTGQIAAVRASEPAEEARQMLILGLVARSMPEPARHALVRRYPFTAAEQRLIAEMGELDRAIEVILRGSLRSSQLDRLLRNLSETALRVGEIVAPPAVRLDLACYRQALRPIRTLLNGDDLKALGIRPGPRYRMLLEGLREAQLDGEVATRPEAEQWILRNESNRQDAKNARNKGEENGGLA